MQLGRKDIYGIGQNECEMPEEISKKPLIQTTNSNVESGWGNTDLELNLQNCNQKQKENYPKAKIKKGQEQSLKQTLWRITGRKKKSQYLGISSPHLSPKLKLTDYSFLHI